MKEKADWSERAAKGFLASGIDPADRRGLKNAYIDFLQKLALEEVLDLKGDERVLDFGCGSGRMSHWIAPRVRKVVGLEVTPEMIELAERHRTAQNTEFVLYDGVHFPAFQEPFDAILSVGVLQTMRGEVLTQMVSRLDRYLRPDGRGYFIEQATDNRSIDRPPVKEYMTAFERSGLECLHAYPVRKGRSGHLYLIRYGLLPRRFFPAIARCEIGRCRKGRKRTRYFQDYLFVLRKR